MPFRTISLPDLTAKDINRFWAKIDKSIPEGCWLWKGGISSRGYGRFKIGRHDWQAHRISFLITYRFLYSNLEICHHCDVQLCVNPKHLFVGTRRGNMLDCSRKGRLKDSRGMKNPGNKLTETQVREIRILLSKRILQKEIASQFGVATSQICHINTGHSWAWLS